LPGEGGGFGVKTAVITDVHSNPRALDAVFRDMDDLGVERVVSLGDAIGYGEDPEAVLDRMEERGVIGVRGNHEQALFDRGCLAGLNPRAREALLGNKALLTRSSLERLRRLERFLVLDGARFVHGLPPDSLIRYLNLTPDAFLASLMAAMEEPLCFVGHTHLLATVTFRQGLLVRGMFEKNEFLLDKQTRYIINAGGVGKPRDGGIRASYVVWDPSSGRVEARFVAVPGTGGTG
jgi:predicted phosphodiesterase